MIGRMQKISDEDIMRILSKKGKLLYLNQTTRVFDWKSDIKIIKKDYFYVKCLEEKKKMNIPCPFNYTGGKFKLLEQLQPLFDESIFRFVCRRRKCWNKFIFFKVIFNITNENLNG